MRSNRLHILSATALAALLALSGCGESNGLLSEGNGLAPEADGNEIMTFSALHPSQQGSSTRVTNTAFEEGDRIGLFITGKGTPLEQSGNYVNNAPLAYKGNQWSTDNPIYWDNGTYDVYAYYPYATPVASVDDYPFTVATDQNGSGYAESDFLWASKPAVSATGSPIALQFRHRMSRMYIKLIKGEEYEGDLPADAEVYVHNTVPTATIDLSAGVVTRNPYGTAQSIRARSLGNHTYAAIIVPQRLDNRQPLVEVIMKGVSYLYESKFLFKPGLQHSVQLAISKNPEQIKIEIGGEIENWE